MYVNYVLFTGTRTKPLLVSKNNYWRRINRFISVDFSLRIPNDFLSYFRKGNCLTMKVFNDSLDSKRPRPTWARRAARTCASILDQRWSMPAGCKFPWYLDPAVARTRQQPRASSISRSAPGRTRVFASWYRSRRWPSTRSTIALATW